MIRIALQNSNGQLVVACELAPPAQQDGRFARARWSESERIDEIARQSEFFDESLHRVFITLYTPGHLPKMTAFDRGRGRVSRTHDDNIILTRVVTSHPSFAAVGAAFCWYRSVAQLIDGFTRITGMNAHY
jgi:hypothetical protein